MGWKRFYFFGLEKIYDITKEIKILAFVTSKMFWIPFDTQPSPQPNLLFPHLRFHNFESEKKNDDITHKLFNYISKTAHKRLSDLR